MATHEQMVEQFRKGEYIDTYGSVGFVALKHVQALGHAETEPGEHRVYVITATAHVLRVPPFNSEHAAQDFIVRCRDASPVGRMRA